MQKIRDLLLEKEQILTELLQTDFLSASSDRNEYLRISNVKGRPSYYLCSRDPASNEKTEQYLRKKDLPVAATLAQQEYDQKIYRLATKQLSLIRRFLKSYDERQLENVYRHLHPARKALITPRVSDWDLFVSEWYETRHDFLVCDPDSGYLTERGEFVRSKSEKIIADKYLKLKIPYQYEKPLTLYSGNHSITIHPDFTLLKEGDFKEYYHEHFGMMDNPEYCKSALQKISLYRNNGIYEGEHLLVTFESNLSPLNIKDLETLIKHHLK